LKDEKNSKKKKKEKKKNSLSRETQKPSEDRSVLNTGLQPQGAVKKGVEPQAGETEEKIKRKRGSPSQEGGKNKGTKTKRPCDLLHKGKGRGRKESRGRAEKKNPSLPRRKPQGKISCFDTEHRFKGK